MKCRYCGESVGFLRGLFSGPSHPQCAEADARRRRREAEDFTERPMKDYEEYEQAKRSALDRARRGEFTNANARAQMMLEQGESCYFVKACHVASFHPKLEGRQVRAFGQTGIREDGIIPHDKGVLHLTNHRLCFVGREKSVNLLADKIIQCEQEGQDLDALRVNTQGKRTYYFIFEESDNVELLVVAIGFISGHSQKGAARG